MTDRRRLPGVTCPGCGGRIFLTVYTRHREKATVRVRKCAKCGHRIRTVERVESSKS